MAAEIVIGVPCYSGARGGENDLLGWCLRSIRERSATDLSYDLLVVDDSGNEEHRAKSKAVAEKFGARHLAHDRNRGIAVGWNTLVRYSDAPIVALINDDIVVSPRWLDALAFFLRNNDRVGTAGLYCDVVLAEEVPAVLAGVSVPYRDPISKEVREHPRSEHTPTVPKRVSAAFGPLFAFTRAAYDTVGGFNEAYESFYEELDFGFSLAAHGYENFNLFYPGFPGLQAPKHIWSATFARSPELDPGGRMRRSFMRFAEKWGACMHGLHDRYTRPKPLRSVRWLGPIGPSEGVAVDGGVWLEEGHP